MAALSNVMLGMQIPLLLYLQVCFLIANNVVMSISLMYEKAEAGWCCFDSYFVVNLRFPCVLPDLMLRKPCNARTDRLMDWRLFSRFILCVSLFISARYVPHACTPSSEVMF